MTDSLIAKEEYLANYNGEDRVISSVELEQYLKYRKDGQIISFNSGFPYLDRLIGGFEGGELIVVTGTTGAGKTLFCQSITKNLFKNKIIPIWFNFELRPLQFLQRFGVQIPYFVVPKTLKEKSLHWIKERIWEAQVKFDIKAVFIDHLYYLVDLMKRQRLTQEIDVIIRQIKKIALERNVAIFLMAHTTKPKSEQKEDLDLSHIRDSGFIACEADTVLLIWRIRKTEKEAVLKIAKDRKNGTWDKKIKLIKNQEGFLGELDVKRD